MICLKVIQGNLQRSRSSEARKGKNHDNIGAKRLLILSDDKFCRLLSNFCRLKATGILLLIYVQIGFKRPRNITVFYHF